MTAGTVVLGVALAVAASLVAGARAAGPGPNDARRNATEETVTFDDVARASGVVFDHHNGASADKHLVETMGSGGLFFDYNDDGWIDILLVDGGSLADPRQRRMARHRLYRNRGNGIFEDATATSGIVHTGYGMGACAGDYDNDGAVDLYITSLGGNALYRNSGKGAFTERAKAAGVDLALWSTSCAFSDLDRDGDLDLVVTNYVDAGLRNHKFCGDPNRRIRAYCHPLNYKPLPTVVFRNDGAGTFTDVSVAAGVGQHVGNGLGIVVSDYDDDGWPDVFVANDTTPNHLFRNDGKGTFLEVGLISGVALAGDGKARAGMGTDFADYDGDGRVDLAVTNHEFETNSLFRNLGRGLFADATAESGIGPPSLPLVGFGVVFLDYDNDTNLDLAIVNGHVIDNAAVFHTGSSHQQRRLLFRNVGGRRFVDVSPVSGPGFAVERVGRALNAGDVDNDGDLDLLVTNNGQAAELLRNRGGNRGRSLLVRLVGKESNRDGIGARLRLTAGGATRMREVKAGSSYLGQHDLRVHFGLGPSAQAERLEVRWPSGKTDVMLNVPSGHIVTVVEGQGVVKRVPFTAARSSRDE